MTAEFGNSPASPALVVRTPDTERSLTAGRTYFIGRDPQSDIVLNDSRVSWRHAVLRVDGSTWLLEDMGSTNGTFQGSSRVQRLAISSSCAVRLGHPSNGPSLSCVVSAPVVQADPVAPGGPVPTMYADGQHAAVAAPPANPAAPRLVGDQLPGGGLGGAGGAGRARAADGYGQNLSPARVSASRPPSAVLQLPGAVLRIGRAADNQVVVADLSVSRYHAELRREARGGYGIYDLGSHNGTFVNGQRVGSAPVTERDIIGIGRANYRLVGEELQEFLDTGDISYVANDLTVTLPNGRVILDHVTFPLGERCLMGVIGPSGAGKSTLLGALTGIAPANHGTVLYDNRDLYMNYAELRNRIGLVPQENILHTQLTARRALGFSAELRFPRDTSKTERNHRIDEVLGELALTRHANTKTAALSGGQQKRVNVALELLTKPSLLFLDEPTSGLDPGLDKSVMQQMADLAHDGRTVIVVTHSVANLDLCDRLLVLVPGGKIAYFGPPRDGLKYFGKPGWAEVFQTFEAERERDWAGEFRRSALCAQYVTGEMAAVAPAAMPRPTGPAPRTRNRLSQLSTLTRRYLSVIASDRMYLGILAGVPIILAAIVRLLGGKQGLTADVPGTNTNVTAVLLILAIGGCFTGAFNAIREIVKEREIYSRERAAGLSSTAYLWSKLIVLGALSALQAALMTVIGVAGERMPARGVVIPSPLLELGVEMALLAIASMTVGLLISSAVNTAEKGLPLLLVSVVLQVVFTGGVISLVGNIPLQYLAWISPSRWGFAAIAATTNLLKIAPPVPPAKPDRLWTPTTHHWLMDMGLLIVLAAVYSLITWRRLAGKRPGRR